MPIYTAADKLDIRRDAVLLDSNLIVGLHDERDGKHEYAVVFFDELAAAQCLVPSAVLQESVAKLVRASDEALRDRKRRWLTKSSVTVKVLQWAMTSPCLVVPESSSLIQNVAPLVGALSNTRISAVDALLCLLADHISKICGVKDGITVCSFDQDIWLPKQLNPALLYQVRDPSVDLD